MASSSKGKDTTHKRTTRSKSRSRMAPSPLVEGDMRHYITSTPLPGAGTHRESKLPSVKSTQEDIFSETRGSGFEEEMERLGIGKDYHSPEISKGPTTEDLTIEQTWLEGLPEKQRCQLLGSWQRMEAITRAAQAKANTDNQHMIELKECLHRAEAK